MDSFDFSLARLNSTVDGNLLLSWSLKLRYAFYKSKIRIYGVEIPATKFITRKAVYLVAIDFVGPVVGFR
ncbi:hypothetical protein HanRHA438_Chr16g0754781 [Helianthus annuus]|nr:hypothetical protein HanIR_Chr16g0807651 [Helianthus annuus]KAJ0835403.1 hypothetical protein HanRHA438_Chr16g0754781 [Helianthus annuus]